MPDPNRTEPVNDAEYLLHETAAPPQDQQQRLAIQASITQTRGPLPPPDELAKYNAVIPNGADRIMQMAERQSIHREQIEQQVIASNIDREKRGSNYAFVLALLIIAGGFALILLGKDTQGFVAIIVAVVGLVAPFFYSKYEQRQERDEKMKALQSRKIEAT